MIRLLALIILISLSLIFSSEINDDNACFDLYSDGEYTKAAECFNKLIISENISDTARLLKIYEKLGAAFVMQDRKDLAKVAFRKMFTINPDIEIDPNKYLPEIVSLFLIAKFEYRTSLRVLILDTIPAYPVKWNYCPFGVPQLLNGHKKKGIVVIGLQALSLGLSIIAYNREQSYRDTQNGFMEEDLEIAGRWDKIHRFSFISFTAITLYSLVDGFVSKPMVIKQ